MSRPHFCKVNYCTHAHTQSHWHAIHFCSFTQAGLPANCTSNFWSMHTETSRFQLSPCKPQSQKNVFVVHAFWRITKCQLQVQLTWNNDVAVVVAAAAVFIIILAETTRKENRVNVNVCVNGKPSCEIHRHQQQMVFGNPGDSTPQNLPYLKQSFNEISGDDCQLLYTIWCKWWNRATGFAIPHSVYIYDPLPAVICFW